jgi:hypothetical protein
LNGLHQKAPALVYALVHIFFIHDLAPVVDCNGWATPAFTSKSTRAPSDRPVTIECTHKLYKKTRLL